MKTPRKTSSFALFCLSLLFCLGSLPSPGLAEEGAPATRDSPSAGVLSESAVFDEVSAAVANPSEPDETAQPRVLRTLLPRTPPSTLAPRMPPPFSVQAPPGVLVPTLSCAACACEDAHEQVAGLRREYRTTHRKVSTLGPRMMMVGGFAGAGVVGALTLLASVVTTPANRPAAGEPEYHDGILLLGGVAMLVPLVVGFAGAGWYGKRVKDGTPHRARDVELALDLKEARLNEREKCMR
jgi:hypothetical protein